MADDHRPLAQRGGQRCALMRWMTRKDKVGAGRQHFKATKWPANLRKPLDLSLESKGSMLDTLITGGHLLTMAGEGVGFVEDGAVGIRGRKIVAVGPRDQVEARGSAATTIDARSARRPSGIARARRSAFRSTSALPGFPPTAAGRGRARSSA